MDSYRRIVYPIALGVAATSASIGYATTPGHPLWVAILAALLAVACLAATVRSVWP